MTYDPTSAIADHLGHAPDTPEGARAALAKRERDARGGWRYLGQPGDAWLLFGALGFAAVADPFGMRSAGADAAAKLFGRGADLGDGPGGGGRAGDVGLPGPPSEAAAAGALAGASALPSVGTLGVSSGIAHAAPPATGPFMGMGVGLSSGMAGIAPGSFSITTTFGAPATDMQPAAAGAIVMQVVVPAPMVVQVNVSVSDHDATAIAVAITSIETITDSIVFIGGNTAIASAVNFAPIIQSNGLEGIFGGGGGWGWGGAAGGFGAGGLQLTQFNHSRSDNDATAIAISASFVGTAVNSIVVFLGDTAQASALNIAPVIQSNTIVSTILAGEGEGLGALAGLLPGATPPAANGLASALESLPVHIQPGEMLHGQGLEQGLDDGIRDTLLARMETAEMAELPDPSAPASFEQHAATTQDLSPGLAGSAQAQADSQPEAPLANPFAGLDDAAFGAGHEAALPHPEALPEVAAASDDLLGEALGAAFREAGTLGEAIASAPVLAGHMLFHDPEFAGALET